MHVWYLDASTSVISVRCTEEQTQQRQCYRISACGTSNVSCLLLLRGSVGKDQSVLGLAQHNLNCCVILTFVVPPLRPQVAPILTDLIDSRVEKTGTYVGSSFWRSSEVSRNGRDGHSVKTTWMATKYHQWESASSALAMGQLM
jgi:hypothetical protein